MNLGNTIRLNKYGTVFVVLLVFVFVFYLLRGENTRSDLVQVNLRSLLIGSIQAAVEGGRKVASVYNSTHLNVQSKGKTKEGANDPVTNADLMSHCAMYYSLTHTFPHIQVISEEKSAESSCRTSQTLDLDPNVLKTQHDLPNEYIPSEDVTVWIDPLDATQEFTESLLEYVTTMVCVAVSGRPVIGVIHSPFSGSTTWAWVGKSTLANVKGEPKTVKIITSRSHQGDVKDFVHKAFGSGVEVIPAGGAGYKSLQVAAGNASAYIHTTLIKKWDICAGDAVLRALGGKMATLNGQDIDYSATSSPANDGGLLATLHNFDYYINKLSPYLPSS